MTEQSEYSIRLDKSEDSNSETIIFWVSRQIPTINRVIAVQEGDGKTLKVHYHLYIQYKKKIKLSAIQKRVERSFSNRGTTKAVATVKKPEQYITYILKGQLNANSILYKYGFTDNEVEDYMARSYTKKKLDPVYVLFEEAKKKNYTDSYQIQQLVFNYYLGKRMPYHQMKSLYQGIYALVDKESAFDNFMRYCEK